MQQLQQQQQQQRICPQLARDAGPDSEFTAAVEQRCVAPWETGSTNCFRLPQAREVLALQVAQLQ